MTIIRQTLGQLLIFASNENWKGYLPMA